MIFSFKVTSVIRCFVARPAANQLSKLPTASSQVELPLALVRAVAVALALALVLDLEGMYGEHRHSKLASTSLAH